MVESRQKVIRQAGVDTEQVDGKQHGQSGAGRFTVTFYLSDDGVTLGSAIRTGSVFRLSAEQSRRMFFSYFTSESLEGRYIIAVIDSGEVMDETIEANNRAVALIN